MIILTIVICLLVSFPAYSQVIPATAKEIYELQELCKNSSDNWYKLAWNGQPVHKVEGNTMMVYYTNHYNRQLNKCLVLEIINHTQKGEKSPSLTNMNLYDINENNRIYGRAIFTGDIDNKKKILYRMKTGTICEVGQKKWGDLGDAPHICRFGTI